MLIDYYEIGECELFDLASDPDELHNVYGDRKYAPIVAQLKRKLDDLRRQYAVPAKDPSPYYPWELPPEYRRPGTPGSTRTSGVTPSNSHATHAARPAHPARAAHLSAMR